MLLFLAHRDIMYTDCVWCADTRWWF